MLGYCNSMQPKILFPYSYGNNDPKALVALLKDDQPHQMQCISILRLLFQGPPIQHLGFRQQAGLLLFHALF